MGFRFHKSIKIAPGLKLNLNKKSVSLTAGTKGAHYTVSSTGRKTASVGIPGTGLSYSTSSGGKKSKSKKKNAFAKIIGIIVLAFVAFSLIRPMISASSSPAASNPAPEVVNSSNIKEDNSTVTYILNTSSHKIHKPTCKMADNIASDNYDTSNLSLEELKEQGYTTCGNCF